MKLLLLGRDGQVGRALAATLPALGETIALGRRQADLEHPAGLAALIAEHHPDVVINAAAYTAVDAAEDDAARAYAVNAEAVGIIGAAARDIGALLVHYSTDYVFDGRGAAAYREDDLAHPVSVYGASKHAGDVAVRDSGADHLILRVSWVYADEGKNFPLSILRLARERESLNVVADQIGAPISADLIARVTTSLLADRKGQSGTFHLAPRGEASWHQVAQAVVAEALAQGGVLKLTPDTIVPITSDQYPSKVARPHNSRLDTSKLRDAFGLDLPPWQEGISRLINTLRAGGRL